MVYHMTVNALLLSNYYVLKWKITSRQLKYNVNHDKNTTPNVKQQIYLWNCEPYWNFDIYFFMLTTNIRIQ